VRLFFAKDVKNFFAFPELIFEPLSLARVVHESRRASALMIGPGFGRTPGRQKEVKALLEKIKLPMVIDADALLPIKFPKGSILTPNRLELERILKKRLPPGDDLIPLSQKYADQNKVILLVKGPLTYLFVPGQRHQLIEERDPGMATAGSGDVLTGIIGALLAQKVIPSSAAPMTETLGRR